MSTETAWLQQTLRQIAALGDIETDPEQLQLVQSNDDLAAKLSELIEHLIDKDFEKLLWILYRIDVDEQRTKQILSEHLPAEAPMILATLIIERQRKKEMFKSAFSNPPVQEEDEDLLL
jgi:hypothetical protein